jgi:hypothetical protein
VPKPLTTTNRTPTETTAEQRTAGLDVPDDDPEATQTLNAIQPERAPLEMRHGEHGHVDGSRGLHDFHTHDGGDERHGHQFRDKRLGRTASIDEYIPPLPATDEETTQPVEVAAVEAPRPTALARADDLGHRSRLEAVERKVRARLAEVQVLTTIQDLVEAGAHQLDIGDLVGPTVIRQFKDTVDKWAADRGVNGG